MTQSKHYNILIIGGGTAGLTVAAQLNRALKNPDIAVLEPSDKHYYQPLWTLVGAGVVKKEVTERDEKDYIPKGVTWLRDYADTLRPDNNLVVTRDGSQLSYDYLVVAPGIQIDWHKVDGLKETLGRNGVCSNYAYEQSEKTWEAIRSFKGGTAIFTNPSTPVKCGGAPQKIMYLADDAFRKAGVRDNAEIIGAFAGSVIFGVPEFAASLEKVIERKGIDMRYHHDLQARDGDKKEATSCVTRPATDTGEPVRTEQVTIPFDMIHVTPPMSAPDFVKTSPLANDAGWLDVDQYTLQSPTYPNVFALGDVAGVPTSKTGAAIRKQAPVVVKNMLATMASKTPEARYNGYTSCPLVTGYGKLILAEFDYDNKPDPTFPIDQTQERYSMYLMKRYGLPFMYWNLMLRGRT